MTSSNAPDTDYVVIFESELRLIAANAAAWGDLETGGGLYGLRMHTGQPVLYLATPAGSNCVREPAYFQQDLHWFQRCSAAMYKGLGVQFQGNWHSHHGLGITRPSSRDLESIVSIAHKNRLQDFVQVIVTHDAGDLGDRKGRRMTPLCERRAMPLGFCSGRWATRDNPEIRVRVDAFLFRPVAGPELVEIPVRVLSGTSPFRLAADNFDEAAPYLSFLESPLPLENMMYKPANASPGNIPFPKQLEQQLLELPQNVLPKCVVTVDPNTVRCEIPVQRDSSLHLEYELGDQAVLVRASLDGVGASSHRDVAITWKEHRSPPTVRELFAFVQRQLDCDRRGLGKGRDPDEPQKKELRNAQNLRTTDQVLGLGTQDRDTGERA